MQPMHARLGLRPSSVLKFFLRRETFSFRYFDSVLPAQSNGFACCNPSLATPSNSSMSDVAQKQPDRLRRGKRRLVAPRPLGRPSKPLEPSRFPASLRSLSL